MFHETRCPQNPVGDHFPGLDDLIEMMGGQGLKFYQSSIPSLTAGPEGIIASDDVVVIKINYQWSERGGSNTDVLRGLIRRIVDHPDSFTGEVVVCENAQFNSTSNFDRPNNNAQDHSLSPHDVVVGFQAQGYKVSHYDWTLIRYTSVDEYDTLDMNDGYVVYDYDTALHGRESYPKFRSDHGTYISLKYGTWYHGVYDRDHLKFINLPVLKSHHSTYGVTAAVKHYMGVVTGYLSTSSQCQPLQRPRSLLRRGDPHGPAGREHGPDRSRPLGHEEHPHPRVHRQRVFTPVALSERRSGRPLERVPPVSRQFDELHPGRGLRRDQRLRPDGPDQGRSPR